MRRRIAVSASATPRTARPEEADVAGEAGDALQPALGIGASSRVEDDLRFDFGSSGRESVSPGSSSALSRPSDVSEGSSGSESPRGVEGEGVSCAGSSSEGSDGSDGSEGVEGGAESGWLGLVPASEPHGLSRGQAATFRIASILRDGKIELSLRGHAHEELADDAATVLAFVSRPDAPRIGDKSSPDDIRDEVGLSKKAFKRAVGRLLKEGKVRIDDDGYVLPV